MINYAKDEAASDLTTVTAVLHHLAPHAAVVGIDHLPGLVEMSRENLRKDGIDLGAGQGRIEMVCGDGREGYPQLGPAPRALSEEVLIVF